MGGGRRNADGTSGAVSVPRRWAFNHPYNTKKLQNWGRVVVHFAEHTDKSRGTRYIATRDFFRVLQSTVNSEMQSSWIMYFHNILFRLQKLKQYLKHLHDFKILPIAGRLQKVKSGSNGSDYGIRSE